MSNDEKRVWGIHTTDDSLFLHNNIIAIGWKEFGDCGSIEPTREAFKDHYCKVYPNAKREQLQQVLSCCIVLDSCLSGCH